MSQKSVSIILVFGDAQAVPSAAYEELRLERLTAGELPKIIRVNPIDLYWEAEKIGDRTGLEQVPAFRQALEERGIVLRDIVAVMYDPGDPNKSEDERLVRDEYHNTYKWRTFNGVLSSNLVQVWHVDGRTAERVWRLPPALLVAVDVKRRR